MPHFHYKVRAARGKVLTGTMVAPDCATAEQRILEMDCRVLELEELVQEPTAVARERGAQGRRLAVLSLLLAFTLAGAFGWWWLRPDPDSPAYALREFHRLLCQEQDVRGALEWVHAFDPQSLEQVTPRLEHVMERFLLTEASLTQVREQAGRDPDLAAFKVVEAYRGRSRDCVIWLTRSHGRWRIDVHRSATLLAQLGDAEELPRDLEGHFATPFQAAVNACHLGVSDEDWWRVFPRLSRWAWAPGWPGAAL